MTESSSANSGTDKLSSLDVYRNELEKQINQLRVEDAVATALMRQAREVHRVCLERISSAEELIAKIDASLADAAMPVPEEDILF